jgi:hypothetical protein
MWGDTGQRGNCNCILTIPVHDSHRMGKAIVTTTTIRFYHYEGIIHTECQFKLSAYSYNSITLCMYICMYVLFFIIRSTALLLQSQHNIFNSYLDGHGESLGLSQSNIDTVKQWFMIITYAFIGLAVLQVRTTSILTEHKFIPYY